MQAEVNLGGMHCASCALDIKETLEEMAGVRQADVSFDDKRAVIEYDEQRASLPTLLKTIEDLGYQASLSAGM